MPRFGPYGPVPPSDERIDPPADLSGPARDLFLDLVRAVRPQHFLPCDVPLLASYCRAAITEAEASRLIHDGLGSGEPVDPTVFKAQKASHDIMHRLAVRLRISPQGRHPTLSSPNDHLAAASRSFYDGASR